MTLSIIAAMPTGGVHNTPVSTAITLAYVVIYLWSWIVAFIDLRRHPEDAFRAIGANKYNWMTALFVFGAFAAVPYLIKVRPRLRSLDA